MAIQNMGVIYPRLGFVGEEIFTNVCFFAPDMLESHSKALKTRILA